MQPGQDRRPVEHVFAHLKTKMGLFIRTIGIARAEAKITLPIWPSTCTVLSSSKPGKPQDRCALIPRELPRPPGK
jgi:hypothetical protein